MLQEISIHDLSFNPFDKISKQWFLITAGDEHGYNTMTASWGTMGILWGKPVVNAFIRSSRHTLGFVENSELLTISFLPESERSALTFCGKYSGRDYDKAKETGLTPVFTDGTTTFEQAELVLVCKKLYAYDITDANMIDPSIQKFYTPDQGGYHRGFFAEIVKVYQKV